MEKVLTTWLPLLVGVLLLLRGCAALLGPNPQSMLGEHHFLDKITQSKKRMVIFVLAFAVGMSLLLALMVLLLTILLNRDFDKWVEVLAICIIAIGGTLFVTFEVFYVSRIFTHKSARAAAAVFVVGAAASWAIWPNWLTTDLFALVILVSGLSIYLQWTLNFLIVALAGAGLFIYDIVNVYFTGNMMRLAKPVMELGLPGMIVVPQAWAFNSPHAAGLGSGDILFPGLMIMLAAVLSYRRNNKSVLYGGLIGYAVGMVLVVGVLYVTKHAQPALITLYPCVLAGILFAAHRAGLTQELFAMRHSKAAHHRTHVHGRYCDCSCQPA